MADPNELTSVIDQTGDLTKKVEQLSVSQQGLADIITKLIGGLKNAGLSGKGFSDTLKGVGDTLLSVGDIGTEATKKMSTFFSKVDASGVTKGLEGMGLKIGAIGVGFAGLVSPLAESGAGVKTITEKLATLGPSFATVAGVINKFDGAMKELKQTQYTAREAIVASGQSLVDTQKIISEYPQALRKMSSETGFSGQQINEFNKTVGRLMPDALRLANKESIGLKDSIGGTIQPTVVAMTAFKAFGIEAQAAAVKTQDAFLNFSQTPLQTAKNLGVMANAAKGTGIDLQTAQDQITKSSQSLAIFGRQTGESAAVWRTFAETLKAGGVPISEVGHIVQGVTKSIAGMSFENRAFIGMMSGMTKGASALGGALKLEFAMRQEGGMQKNLEALTGTLGKFAGGRIISLEQAQAANNPQLEQQFVLQRQMLGKLTNIADPEQQNRILEVMQKVQQGGISAIDADKAMKEIYDKGKNLQQESLTVQEKMYQALRAILAQQVGSDEALDKLDKSLEKGITFGGAKPGEPGRTDPLTLLSKMKAEAAEDPEKARRERNRVEMMYGKEEGPGRRSRPAIRTPRRAVEPPQSILKAGLPTAAALPTSPILRAGAPAASIPGLTNISSTISRGDAQTHRDLQQLLEATRAGLAPLRDVKPPAAAGPAAKATPGAAVAPAGPNSTLTIRFEGTDEKTIARLKKLIQDDFERNTLGIYGE